MNLIERRLKRAAKAELRNPARVSKSLELTPKTGWRLKPMKSIQKSKLNTTQKIMLELYEYCSCNKTIAREARIKPERLIQFIDGEAEATELEHDRLFILRCRYMSQDMQGEPLCEHDIENYVDIRGI